MKHIIFPLLSLRFQHFRAAIFFLAVVILTCSCKKKDVTGYNIQPGNEQLGLLNTDTTTLNLYTVLDDSLRTDETSINLLGSYVDPEFGYAEAGIYAQILLSSEGSAISNVAELIVDSVILSLVYYDNYGDETDAQSFSVYELTEDIYRDSIYYSGRNVAYSSMPIGRKYDLKPNINDSTVVGGTNEPAQMRIALSKSFGQKLLNASDNSTNDIFLSNVKGLFIAPSHSRPALGQVGSPIKYITHQQAPGEGAIYYLDLLDQHSRVMVYYHHATTGTPGNYEYYINEECARINAYVHDFNSYNLETALNDQSIGKNLAYVQSMAGAKIKLDIPYLENLIDDKPVAIIKAELTMTLQDGTANTYSAHDQLFVVGIDSSGKSVFIADQFEDATHYGGALSNSQYSFNITRHVQGLLSAYIDGKDENYGLYLVSGGGSANANRTIIKGSNSASGRMKLILSYTPL